MRLRTPIVAASVLALSFLQVTAICRAGEERGGKSSAPSMANQDAGPDQPSEALMTLREGNAHMLGLRMDVGSASSLAAGYIHAHWFGIGWFGYGADLSVLGAKFGRADAVAGLGVVRLVIGHSPPMAMELAMGAGTGDGASPGIARFGGFLSFFYADVGYSYSMPLRSDRPDWLSSHQFAVRVHIPLHWYGTKEP